MTGDPFELTAVLLVADDRLTVKAHEHLLGDWPLSNVSANLRPDGCHVAVDGETMIVTVPHPVRLTEAIGGAQWTDPADDSLDQVPATEPAPPLEETEDDPGFWARIPSVWKLSGAGAVAVALLGVFAPTALIGLLLLVALGLLLGGAVGYLDPFTAVRLPDLLTPQRLLGAGSAVVAVALVLAITIT